MRANNKDEALAGRAQALGLVDQAPVALIVTDRQGTIATWNGATEQLLGWRRGEVTGLPITRIAVEHSADKAAEVVASARDGRTHGAELELQDKHGHRREVHLRGAPLRNGSDEIVGVLLAALNATELLEAESEEARAHAIGRRLARARKEAGLTQQELADRLKVTRRSLQGYEAGAVVPYRRIPSIATLLGRPVTWFLTGHGSEPVAGDDLRELLREELPEILKDAARSSAA